MRPHTFRPSVESLDYRDNPGTSWGPPWVFGLAEFLVSTHLIKVPKIKFPKAITSPTTPKTPLPYATVSSIGTATSVTVQGSPGATVVSAVATPISVSPPRIHLPPHHVHSPHR
jgi:hypothetical protein